MDDRFESLKTRLRQFRGIERWTAAGFEHQSGDFDVRYVGRERLLDGASELIEVPRIRNDRLSFAGPGNSASGLLQSFKSSDVLVVDPLLSPLATLGLEGLWLRVAPHLRCTWGVAPDQASQLQLVRSRPYRRYLRGLRYKPQWSPECNAKAVKTFYREYFEPMARLRFGANAHLVPEATLLRTLRRFDGSVLRDAGDPTVQVLVHRHPKLPTRLAWWKVGIRDAQNLPSTMRKRAVARAELMVSDYAREKGFSSIDLGICRAVPGDGIMIHKRRLGCSFTADPYQPSLLMRVRRDKLADWFAHHPIYVEEAGKLVALMGYRSLEDGMQLKQRLREIGVPHLEEVQVWARRNYSPPTFLPSFLINKPYHLDWRNAA